MSIPREGHGSPVDDAGAFLFREAFVPPEGDPEPVRLCIYGDHVNGGSRHRNSFVLADIDTARKARDELCAAIQAWGEAL